MWETAHPIGISTANASYYLPDGFVFRMLLWKKPRKTCLGWAVFRFSGVISNWNALGVPILPSLPFPSLSPLRINALLCVTLNVQILTMGYHPGCYKKIKALRWTLRLSNSEYIGHPIIRRFIQVCIMWISKYIFDIHIMYTYINVRIERGLVVMDYGVDVREFGTMATSYVISALLCVTLNGQILTMGYHPGCYTRMVALRKALHTPHS